MFKGTYDTLSSHKMMIKDSYRTFSYYKAIQKCVQRGDVVIDYGSGSGLLSLLSARCGAQIVYAIERNPKTAAWLQHNISINGLGEKIVVFIGDAEQFMSAYPDLNVNVVISECIGDHLFENKMIKEFLHLSKYYNVDKKIPSEFDLNLYPNLIVEKDKILNLALTNLKDLEVEIDLNFLNIDDKILDVSYFNNFKDNKDLYFTLPYHNQLSNKDLVFRFNDLDSLESYSKNNSIITKEIDIPKGTGYLMLYFNVLLYGDVYFTNHPSRSENVEHSYFQRLIKKQGEKGHLCLDINYDQIMNEDCPCENVWIEYE